MKRIFKIILMLFLTATGYSQNSVLDSLFHVISSSNHDSIIASAHSQLAFALAFKDFDAAMAHLDSASVIYEDLKDEEGIADSHYRYAALNRVSGNYKKALVYIEQFNTYAKSKKDTALLANGSFQKGVIYDMQGDYENSLKELYKTLLYYETLRKDEKIGFTLNSIGIVYKNLGKYPEAADSFRKAIRIHEKLHDSVNLPNAYNNLGTVYKAQNDYEQALEYYNKALEIDVLTNNNWGISINKQNVGEVLIDKGEYEEALIYLNDAYDIQERHDYNTDLGVTISKLGMAYFYLNNYSKSEAVLKKGLMEATNSKLVNQDLHFTLYNLYRKTNNFKQALHHHEKYIAYKDSIFNEKNLKNINSLQIQFETQKKDNEIATQNLQLQAQENDILKKKNQFNLALGGGGFLLLGGLGLWLFYRQRQKLKNNEIFALHSKQEVVKLEALIDGEEKERNRLAQDLHDGINGDLAVIKYKVSSIEKSKLDKKEKTAYNEAISMLDNAVEQVRRISHNLAPPSLHNFDLIEAIQQFCSKQNASHPVNISFQYFGNRLVLKKENETAIYRIIQELLNNIIKHSNASEALVQLNNHDSKLIIIVEDNGKGFDVNTSNSGIGLQNIKSRVGFLKADLDINSTSKGTTFSIEIDLKKLKAV